MKCEKCNNKDANFHFKANINGEISEHHMCSECAEESGLKDAMASSFGRALDRADNPFMSMFPSQGNTASPMGGSFGGFSIPLSFGNMLIHPLFMPMFPSISQGIQPAAFPQPGIAVSAEESEAKIPGDAGEDMRKKREISALRHQMANAVKEENFEQAAVLRDKISIMEKGE